MSRPGPTPAVKATVAGLIQAAATGRADLEWLRKALADSGYIAKGDRVSKGELDDALSAVVGVLRDLGGACAATCGQHVLDRIQQSIERLHAINRAGQPEPTPGPVAAPPAV
jgi:hypothetical protein